MGRGDLKAEVPANSVYSVSCRHQAFASYISSIDRRLNRFWAALSSSVKTEVANVNALYITLLSVPGL